jgi:hypothetical protein
MVFKLLQLRQLLHWVLTNSSSQVFCSVTYMRLQVCEASQDYILTAYGSCQLFALLLCHACMIYLLCYFLASAGT